MFIRTKKFVALQQRLSYFLPRVNGSITMATASLFLWFNTITNKHSGKDDVLKAGVSNSFHQRAIFPDLVNSLVQKNFCKNFDFILLKNTLMISMLVTWLLTGFKLPYAFRQRRLDVVFLQKTHSDIKNAADWAREWDCFSVLSHNTSLSWGCCCIIF